MKNVVHSLRKIEDTFFFGQELRTHFIDKFMKKKKIAG
jgi:hypothetical protein